MIKLSLHTNINLVAPDTDLKKAEQLHAELPANPMAGWLTLPTDYDKDEYTQIKTAAQKINQDSDYLVCIGIGGSYLGARAAIEYLGSMQYNDLNDLKVYFVGNNISPDYLNNILKLCEGKRLSVNVISKSGTTTESALAFRVFKKLMECFYCFFLKGCLSKAFYRFFKKIFDFCLSKI